MAGLADSCLIDFRESVAKRTTREPVNEWHTKSENEMMVADLIFYRPGQSTFPGIKRSTRAGDVG